MGQPIPFRTAAQQEAHTGPQFADVASSMPVPFTKEQSPHTFQANTTTGPWYTSNGYEVLMTPTPPYDGLWDQDPPLDMNVLVGGRKTTTGVLAGVTARLFAWIGDQWNTRVEPLEQAPDSFDWRSKRGSVDDLQRPWTVNWSEHSAGTAVDFNASAHPEYTPTDQTFTAAQIDEMHTILHQLTDDQGCVVNWGGDWTNPIDSQHIERAQGVSDERIVALLDQLDGGTTPVPPVTPPTPPPTAWADLLETLMALTGAPTTWDQAVDDITNRVVNALQLAGRNPQGYTAGIEDENNAVQHGENYDHTKQGDHSK